MPKVSSLIEATTTPVNIPLLALVYSKSVIMNIWKTGRILEQQLAALDVMSNPVLQSAREHLLAAKQSIETGNNDKAVSELYILRQLKLLHHEGMMTMKLPMTRDLNSTFNSAEAHLLAAGEAINGYDPQRAISELDIASEQLYAHQRAMLNVINSLFTNTRTHFQQSINDLNISDTKAIRKLYDF